MISFKRTKDLKDGFVHSFPLIARQIGHIRENFLINAGPLRDRFKRDERQFSNIRIVAEVGWRFNIHWRRRVFCYLFQILN